MENKIINGDSEELEIASKSQLKRESHAIQKLGKRLAALSGEQLGEIPLDETLREAIALAHKIQNKRSALKRHYQFMGKLLRARDTKAIITALEKLEQANHDQIRRHHRAEYWRDQITGRGIAATEDFLAEQPNADRQKLRQLWRNYSSVKTAERKTHFARLIYREIFQGLDG
ncbi:MAG: ribosome biogenesis factor YjgA [Gammaproteobacteria bacterium]